jgi:hypothetical protein
LQLELFIETWKSTKVSRQDREILQTNLRILKHYPEDQIVLTERIDDDYCSGLFGAEGCCHVSQTGEMNFSIAQKNSPISQALVTILNGGSYNWRGWVTTKSSLIYDLLERWSPFLMKGEQTDLVLEDGKRNCQTRRTMESDLKRLKRL